MSCFCDDSNNAIKRSNHSSLGGNDENSVAQRSTVRCGIRALRKRLYFTSNGLNEVSAYLISTVRKWRLFLIFEVILVKTNKPRCYEGYYKR
jgi:hypothetical protein